MDRLCVLGLLCIPAFGEAGGTPCVPTGNSTCHVVSAQADSTAQMIVSTLLIGFGIVFEKGKDKAFESVSKSMAPILNSLFAELTLLGIINLALYVLEQATILKHISIAIFHDDYHLIHIFHQIHMMLFFVMVLFLLQTCLLIGVAYWAGQEWGKSEILAHDRSVLISSFNHTGFCAMFKCCRKNASEVNRDALNYAALRERFIAPRDDDEGEDDLPPINDAKTVDGSIECILSADNASEHRKKLTVHAFKADAPVKIAKHWGNSEGKVGDWVVIGGDDDVYVCNNDLFEETYEPTKKSHEYRKKTTVLARKFNEPFVARTFKGGAISRQNGPPGSWLIQSEVTKTNNPAQDLLNAHSLAPQSSRRASIAPRNSTVARIRLYEQYVLNPSDFKKMYENVTEKEETKDKDQLRKDFDFCMYLNLLMGHNLAEVVEVHVNTWFGLWIVLLGVWAFFLIVNNDLVFDLTTIFGGYALILLCWFMKMKLRAIRRALTSKDYFQKARRHSLMRASLRKKKISPRKSARRIQKQSPSLDATPRPNVKELKAAADSMSVDSQLLHLETNRDNTDKTADDTANTVTSLPNSVGRTISTHDSHDSNEDHSVDVKTEEGDEPFVAPNFKKLQSAFNRSMKRCKSITKPPYLDRKPKGRGKCMKRILGRPANKHEQLFWFDHHGPEILIHMIQAVMLLSALYITAAIRVWLTFYCKDSLYCALIIIGVLIPPILCCSLMPYIIMDLVVVTSVEKMRKPHVISEVNRTQNISRSMRALRLLSAMSVYTKKEEVKNKKTGLGIAWSDRKKSTAGGSAAKVYGRGTARYTKRRAELAEAFSLFDRDSTGSISAKNLGEMLQFLGVSDETQQHAMITNMLAQMDMDKSDSIEFGEFFDWVASSEATAADRSDELTKAIFKTIDHDGDEVITGDELRASLMNLGGVLTHDDVMTIVREADTNGDGAIDLEEFTSLMRHAFHNDEFSL